jgi:phosphatidylinositol-bisphosphatase
MYATSHYASALLADLIAIAFSSPIDLRMVNIPLHTRLSPASAGSPGDDATDIDIVREHWIYNKAIEEASAGSSTLLLYA